MFDDYDVEMMLNRRDCLLKICDLLIERICIDLEANMEAIEGGGFGGADY